jgi:hypothetical protein
MDAGILIPAAIGWTAEHLGLYTLEIFIDDSRQRSIPVLIRDETELSTPQE